MIRYGLILLLICFCAALVLSVTYKFTHTRIEAQAITEEKAALDVVYPQASDFSEEKLGDETYYAAKKDNKLIGYIIRAKTRGYSSTINMLVGFDPKGEIKGIKILSQEETPGLGAKINEVRFGDSKPWFLNQFEGKKAQELDLKSIQAITGATISSSAVIDGVRDSAKDFISKIK
ncbi:MAG: RnfABCDGE type electron transport complex subunit G [Candidatus Omnitrophica bacterium]|nr:RnfABCDGE type electron transport complex subunit G [Candidatus Omnitrophota bacterium]HOX54794.1 RnfABCDGE type electron transport complex subunit G [Candidatus Omnitrophota bacterium]